MAFRSLAMSLLLAVLAGCNCDVQPGGDAGSGGGSASGGGAGGGGAGGGGAGGGGGGGGGGTAAGGGGGAIACAGQPPTCLGVCAATPPSCVEGIWECRGPGYQAVETRCDGFDNDCDGQVDEGCATCEVNLAALQQNLFSKWDLDFDAQCTGYLTTLVSGPDSVTVVPPDGGGAPATYLGNANQNMGYALVDTDPAHQRLVVVYSCCEACSCQAKNGVTLLYTCDAGTPGCGCAGATHCPGFLDAPFLEAGLEDLKAKAGALTLTSPTGLAAGPGSHYYVGNWHPATCAAADAGCTACDPAHPALTCSPTRPACCEASGLGRLAEFTLPEGSVEPTIRVVAVYPGEEILNLASTSAGEVLVATSAADGGTLHRFNPATGASAVVASFATPVYSVVQDVRQGDLYLELLTGSPRLRRLGTDGGALALPDGVPGDPTGLGVLQFGPDHRLYRLQGVANGTSTLGVYAVP